MTLDAVTIRAVFLRAILVASIHGVVAGSAGGVENAAWPRAATNGMRDLNAILRPLLEKSKLPALAAAVVRETNIIAAGVAGVRKAGADEPVTLEDKFHIGSCTKSITALLSVLLEKEGAIRLESTIGDLLDWKLPAGAREITLRMLLQNRSGMGNDPPKLLWARAFLGLGGSPPEQREKFLKKFLEKPLAAKPNTQFIYSNFGYALAGTLLERKLGQPWEELVRARIFTPLGLATAGFGAPASPGKIDQPLGHKYKNGVCEPVPPLDNPVVIAPAGAVHMSIVDLARYAAFHLAVAQGKIPELRDYVNVLYQPPEGSDYALGWLVQERSWAGGKALTHAGSNTMYYCLIWIAPAKSHAFVLAANAGERNGNEVAKKCDEAIGELIRAFIPPAPKS